MTVPTSTAKSGPYAGAGTTGPFTVGFRFLENSHLQVIRTSTLGIDSTLALTTDYTVTGAGGASGTVTLVAALAVGEKLTIIRSVPLTQDADYVQNDAFPAESHERALDKLTMEVQQVAEEASRAIKAQVSDSVVDMTLPFAATRANKYLSFDLTGKPVSTTFDIDAVQAASTAAINSAAAALASETSASGSAATANAQAALITGTVASVTPQIVNFSGTGAQVAFTLPNSPGAEENTLVFISGVYQQKSEYSVVGSTMTFTAAPPAGTLNIEVQIGPSVQLALTSALASSYLPAGTGAVATTVQAKLRESVSVFDYIPQAEHAAIQNGTSTYDCTAAIAQAIANCSVVTGQPYGFEKTIVFPQGYYSVQHIDLTARTNVWMYTEGYVVIKGINSTAKNFVFGSTNYNPAIPANSTQTPNCFLGGPGQWEFFAAPGTAYQYGMRLEHFTGSIFENVSSGSGYVTVTDINAVTGSRVGAYLQLAFSNRFTDCAFSCPAAPPVGGKSIGLAMDNNNNNSNIFIRCNWQGANVTAAPYDDTVGVVMTGVNNVWDTCDLSALNTAFIGNGSGHQIRNVYSEYVTTFVSGAVAGLLNGLVVQGGLIEIVNSGSAYFARNTQNLNIIGGFYKGAFVGTKTFLNQTSGSLYGVNIISPLLNTGDFANISSGTYQNPDALAQANILQSKWLTFPTTQIPSTEPNTLDDYEEGTWTPTKTTGTAYSSASGRYIKIGNVVVATFIVQFAVEVNGAASNMSGFPFAANGAASEKNGLAVGYQSASVNVGGSLAGSTMTFRQIGTGVSGGATITQMSGSLVSGTMTYTLA